MYKTPGWLTSLGVAFAAAAILAGTVWAEKGTVANEELAHPVTVQVAREMAVPINVDDLQDGESDVRC